MGFKNKRAHLDKNHTEIVTALIKSGAYVLDLATNGGGCADILAVTRPDSAVLLEIKQADGKFTIEQLQFLAAYRGYCAWACTAESAIKIARSPMLFALSEKDKRRLLKIVLECQSKGQKEIRVSAFEKRFLELSK